MKTERFTVKIPNPKKYKITYCNGPVHTLYGDWPFIRKLGKLEDIEERWNINIEIVDKAINDGIYIRSNVNHDIILVYPSFSIGHITKKYYFEYDYLIFKEETYGQDWALSKEELL